jgi:two-component system cell cycle response regulator
MESAPAGGDIGRMLMFVRRQLLVRHVRVCSGLARAGSMGPAGWGRRLVVAMAGIVLLYGLVLVFRPLGPEVSLRWRQFALCSVLFGASALSVMRGRVSRGERLAWWSFAFAMALWGIASVFYFVLLESSIGDVLWLAAYLPAQVALFSLLNQQAGSAGRGVWIDALVAGLGVAAAGATAAFQIALNHRHGSGLATAIQLAIPVGDLGLLALVAAAVTVTGWRICGVWRWIAPAFGIFAVIDSIYVVQAVTGTWRPGGILDLGWAIAALLVGLAAWQTEAPVRSEAQIATRAVLPASGLVVLALLVVDHFATVNLLALGLATVSLGAILLRLYLTMQDNARLLVHSRSQAATDSLTGLGNRRALMEALQLQLPTADDGRPLVLVLFDLDGFKNYNDSFGHPAGDALLAQLGHNLALSVAERGQAYRLGGDEFCALLQPGDDVAQPIIDATAAALTVGGKGFTIGCSYGSVVLPREAPDVEGALQLADQRMYVSKRSGRRSAGRQSSDVLLRAMTERDEELGSHVREVAVLAQAVAVRLGLSALEVEHVGQAAELHDIGKVAIPDAVLHKAGPLNEREWNLIRGHTVIGERIIAAAPALHEVAMLVRSSHERFDGDGYPDGLRGPGIPLGARILAICDSFTAMNTDRVYRPALEATHAIAELRRCAGTQFDPMVVEAFCTEWAQQAPVTGATHGI